MTLAEAWKPVVGYERFMISDHGNMLGVRGKPLARVFDSYGYPVATLEARLPTRKTIKVHREVWKAFVGPIPEGFVINHKNGIKHDNRLENLEVVTPRQNTRHAIEVLGYRATGTKSPCYGMKSPRAKLTDSDVRLIRQLFAEGLSVYAITKRFPVEWPTINRIVKGNGWPHVL